MLSQKTIFFDLDGTIYPGNNGLWDQIALRIDTFIENHLDIPVEDISSLRANYYLKYGTTLRGLQIHHQINPEEYLQFVHDIPANNYLELDRDLFSMLDSLPHDKWIFTNSDTAHVTRILSALGIQECFTGIISIESLDFKCKPMLEAYSYALQTSGCQNPEDAIFIEDSLRNLIPAKDMGIFTILISSEGEHSSVDVTMPRIQDLKSYLPELWS